jgi:hypothetical protein
MLSLAAIAGSATVAALCSLITAHRLPLIVHGVKRTTSSSAFLALVLRNL